MQTITLAEVKAAAREYHAAGKLTAQHPVEALRKCVYSTDDGYRCAVGAAFDDRTLDRIVDSQLNEKGVSWLIDGDIISVPVEERGAIEKIQLAYDNWAIAASYGHGDEAERRFLALIQG